MKRGVLLIQLGTPKGSDLKAVRHYLRVFLMDKRVVDLNLIARFILVYFFIIPLRSRQSQKAYQAIWMQQGSPLAIHSEALALALQKRLGSSYQITLGMRYLTPSIQSALHHLKQVDELTIIPLFPQYSSAVTGSALEEVLQQLRHWVRIPSLKIVSEFYRHPAYIQAQAQVVLEACKSHPLQKDSYILFSYHGLPQRQLETMGCDARCEGPCPQNSRCYRSQCYQTSHLLASALGLAPSQYSSSFQSRLGKTPWIKPYTDDMLRFLAQKNVKDLRILCPSFVSDCVETLEEIGIRAKAQWLALSGTQLLLLPCLNAHPQWVEALAGIIQDNSYDS